MPPALVLDLVAAVLDGGASPVTAARRVADALEAIGDPAAVALVRCTVAVGAPVSPPSGLRSPFPGRPPGQPSGDVDLLAESLGQALQLATGTGLAPAPLVRRAAAHHRRRLALAATAAARRLGVFVMLPTGLCLLPAFVLLGLVPVVIDMVAGLGTVLP